MRRSCRRPSKDNETIKEGETPEDWKSKPAKNHQKDKDARWTKKDDRSYFGYKNHIGVDRRHKFVRRYVVSDASVHDSQKFGDVLDTSNTASEVWADGAYRSDEIEEKLAAHGLKSRIHRRAYRNRKTEGRASASSMYLVIKRTGWEPGSCAPSASSARGAKSE
jgi:IS5 family transposase